jgi:hypothetical protein
MISPVQLTIKIPDALRRQTRSIAALRGETMSDVVRAALEAYVAEHQNLAAQQLMEGHELKEGDALYNIIGIGEGGPHDLSSNKHTYATD